MQLSLWYWPAANPRSASDSGWRDQRVLMAFIDSCSGARGSSSPKRASKSVEWRIGARPTAALEASCHGIRRAERQSSAAVHGNCRNRRRMLPPGIDEKLPRMLCREHPLHPANSMMTMAASTQFPHNDPMLPPIRPGSRGFRVPHLLVQCSAGSM